MIFKILKRFLKKEQIKEREKGKNTEERKKREKHRTKN